MPRPVKPKKPDSIDAVAAAAGVSVMTVSRVMRGKANVAAKTRDRVMAAVEQLGYVHNRLASSLASSTSAQIGVIIPSLRNIVFPEVLAGITDTLESTDYQAVIGVTDYDLDRELRLVNSMLAWRPAGIIIANTTHHDETRALLTRAQIPVVEIMEVAANPIDMNIGIDHYQVGQKMASCLLDKGYRRFAYLGSDHKTDHTAAKRYQGFVAGLSQGKGEMILSVTASEPSSISLGRENMTALLTRRKEFEAVYFSNDAVAAGAMMCCLEAKLDIPGDIGIAGFGGLEIARAMPIPIATIYSPRYEMGQHSAQLIMDRLSRKPIESKKLAQFELMLGGSI